MSNNGHPEDRVTDGDCPPPQSAANDHEPGDQGTEESQGYGQHDDENQHLHQPPAPPQPHASSQTSSIGSGYGQSRSNIENLIRRAVRRNPSRAIPDPSPNRGTYTMYTYTLLVPFLEIDLIGAFSQ